MGVYKCNKITAVCGQLDWIKLEKYKHFHLWFWHSLHIFMRLWTNKDSM